MTWKYSIQSSVLGYYMRCHSNTNRFNMVWISVRKESIRQLFVYRDWDGSLWGLQGSLQEQNLNTFRVIRINWESMIPQKQEGCGTNLFRNLSTLTIVIVWSYIHIGIVLRFQGAPEEHIFQKSRGGADQITRRVKQTGEIWVNSRLVVSQISIIGVYII